ncbi:MAG: PSD1 and planctomycete cytochrome C domain-containing protein [Planctomycetes bacterium]|nr:PSD1 and planctomycete cytochrome C domain-containing protein [Planctomycetota bacterium]
MLRIFLAAFAVPLLASSAFAVDPKLTPEQTTFFENKIRPILVEHCYSCHGEKKDKGGLRLDTRAAVLKGGDSGPAVVPGKPEASPLVKAVKFTDPHLQMPPKGKLTPEQIAALTDWVKDGAPDPRTTTPSVAADPYDFTKLVAGVKTHWSFQPVVQPKVPQPANSNPIDGFLLAKLSDKGLSFAKPADKRTLIRRATFDLHGVPPTAEEVEAFEKDTSPNAYESLLDRLLKSPRYGERWGRHWLDVARYADNQGAIFNNKNDYPYAWTYRDYVIRAFNEDLPFDRFVTEQLAADLLPAKPGDNRNLAALGFMTVGRKPDGVVSDDVIDDRIDTVSRGLLGLTAGCARCHDHKLEPIPTVDYYGLYSIFKSTKDPDVLPVLEPQANTPDALKYKADNEKARNTAVETHARVTALTLIEVRSRVGEYLLSVHEAGGKNTYQNPKAKDDVIKKKLHELIHNSVAGAWAAWVKGNTAMFTPWEEFAKLPAADFAAKAKPLAEGFAANADKKLNPLVAKAFAGKPPESLAEVAKRYTDLFASVDAAWHNKAADELAKLAKPMAEDATAGAAQFGPNVIARHYKLEQALTLGDGDDEKLRKLMTDPKSPFAPTANQFGGSRLYSKESQDAVNKVAGAITALDAHPGAPARAMIVQEVPPYNGKVFVRGNPRIQGAPAPRAFFTALSGPERKPFPATSSGRLELAKAIVDPTNPLTARVFVNRVWGWHFGKGLVGTASDFGFRGDKPTHPELLDYLAAKFVAEGWSVKKLHKQIMLTAAYRQSSRSTDASANGTKADPENKLLWKMPLRKLEFEAYRDSMLAVAGRLDPLEGGKPANIAQPTTLRRTVYAFVDRKTLPNLFRSFDFPDPNFSSASRTSTTLPPQALFLMNSPFVVENAKALATAVKPMSATDKPAAVKKLYRAVLQREATPAEIERALKFLDLYPANDVVVPEATTWSYGFADYDDKTKKVAGFTPLAFAGGIVKGTKIGNVDVTGLEIGPDGGKAAKVKAACRRWTAPDDGKIDVVAELSHTAPAGDGVLCRIVSSRLGLLGEWTAANESVPTKLKAVEVKKGDTLDFLTFSKSDPTGNTFRWAPTITMPERQMSALPGTMMKWDAKTHFFDTTKLPAPLGPWEELAQVLLLSNEFAVAE